jgi:hypothetical protein
MILTDMLITTLLSASAVLGLQATAAPPAPAPVSSARHQGTDSAASGESVVLVFRPVNRFGASSAGLKPGALSDRAPHPVAVLHVKSDSAQSSSRTEPRLVDQFAAAR